MKALWCGWYLGRDFKNGCSFEMGFLKEGKNMGHKWEKGLALFD